MKKSFLLIFLMAAVAVPVLVYAQNNPADQKNFENASGTPAISSEGASSIKSDGSTNKANSDLGDAALAAENSNSKAEIPKDIISMIQKKPYLFFGANYLSGGLLATIFSNNENINKLVQGYLEEIDKKDSLKTDNPAVGTEDTILKDIQDNNFGGFIEKLNRSIGVK